MKLPDLLLMVLAAMATNSFLAGCGNHQYDTRKMLNDVRIEGSEIANLEEISVYFAHQSVGDNILNGVRALLAGSGYNSVRVGEVGEISDLGAGRIGHSYVGSNGDPVGKLSAFADTMNAGIGVDIAFVKLCYVDVYAGLTAEELFAEYSSTLSALEKAWPDTTFVHLTMPLTTKQGAFGTRLKNLAKRVLGRGTIQPVDWNQHRHAYNELIRQNYQNTGRLFDLARLESTPTGLLAGGEDLPDASMEAGGTPQLLEPYTDDGAHLNEIGGLYVGRELLIFLNNLAD